MVLVVTGDAAEKKSASAKEWLWISACYATFLSLSKQRTHNVELPFGKNSQQRAKIRLAGSATVIDIKRHDFDTAQ